MSKELAERYRYHEKRITVPSEEGLETLFEGDGRLIDISLISSKGEKIKLACTIKGELGEEIAGHQIPGLVQAQEGSVHSRALERSVSRTNEPSGLAAKEGRKSTAQASTRIGGCQGGRSR